MLVLTRKVGEQIQIGPDVTVTVTRIGLDRIKLGIDAPGGILITRGELMTPASPPPLDMVDGMALARRTPAS